MPHTHFLCRAALAAFLSVAAASANAALTTYSTSASFAAAVTSPLTDTFDDLTIPSSAIAFASPLTRHVGTYEYSASAPEMPADLGLFPAGTVTDSWLGPFNSGAPLVFSNFVGGVKAIGGQFFAANIGGDFLAGQKVTVTVIDSQGATASTIFDAATLTSFAGFSSTGTISSLTISVSNVEAFAVANNLILAQVAAPVPEPAAGAMLLAGMGALAALRRRRSA